MSRYSPSAQVHRINPTSRLAGEYHLVLKYHKEFHDIFTEFSDHSEFGPLMTKMQVVDAHGGSKMDEEQWEAASKYNVLHLACVSLTPRPDIYVGFIFEKQ